MFKTRFLHELDYFGKMFCFVFVLFFKKKKKKKKKKDAYIES